MTGKALAILAVVVLLSAAVATYFLAGWPTALEDQEAARTVVEAFGKKLQNVNILADKTMAADAINREYGPYVSQTLLSQWQNDPSQAPGRLTSSPWPDRIDIKSSERESRSRYVFKGDIVEVSNEGGGVDDRPSEAVRRPVVATVENQNGSWRITEVVLGAYPGEAKWISSVPTEKGLIYLYPERIPTTFISAQEWPPTIEPLGRAYSCKEASASDASQKTTQKHMIGDREYCVTESSEGAAGSVYHTYEYAFTFGDSAYRITFTLRMPQCDNYDEPQKGACKAEEGSFSVDNLVDKIAQSIQIAPAK